MIKTLTAWRGIMAVAIVLFHYHVAIFQGAELFSVCFFYVVSGFLLALRYDAKPVPVWRRFFAERALRLTARCGNHCVRSKNPAVGVNCQILVNALHGAFGYDFNT